MPSISRILQKCFDAKRIADLIKQTDQSDNIQIQGWVRRAQRFAKKTFVKMGDGSSSHQIQAVIPRIVCPSVWVDSAIRLRGSWIPSRGGEQTMEFLADECIITGKCEEQRLDGDNDILRRVPHLRAKTEQFASVLRMRSKLTHLTHEYFDVNSFFHVDTPLLSQNDCEGAGETFTVASPKDPDFFDGSQAFLQVSSQLHLEALAGAIPRVYTISPAFRAEKSPGRMHMAEFVMLEAECAFMDSLSDLCDVVESYVRFVARRIRNECPDDFRASAPFCERSTGKFGPKVLIDCMTDRPFPRITYNEAIGFLDRTSQLDEENARALSKKEELELVEKFQGPLFVTHFMAKDKPFYMRRTGGDDKFTESFDFLGPVIGELASGGVREWDLNKLRARLSEVNAEKLGWYLELRRIGYPRSAGFGLGIDRMMQSLFGIQNIKDAIPFPRWYRHIKC